MTREQYLAEQRKASEAALAAIMTETEQQIAAELAQPQTKREFRYVPEGGGEERTARSGKWLLDLE